MSTNKLTQKLTELITWTGNWLKRIWTYWTPTTNSGTLKRIQTLMTSIKDLTKAIIYESHATWTLIFNSFLVICVTLWDLPPWVIVVYILWIVCWISWVGVIRELAVILVGIIRIFWQYLAIFFGPIVDIVMDSLEIILKVIVGFLGLIGSLKLSAWLEMFIIVRQIAAVMLILFGIYMGIMVIIEGASSWISYSIDYVTDVLSEGLTLIIDILKEFIARPQDISSDNPIDTDSIITDTDILSEGLKWLIDAIKEGLYELQDIDNNTSPDNPSDSGQNTPTTDTSTTDTSTTDSTDKNTDKDTSTTDSTDKNSDKNSIKTSTVLDDLLEFINWILTKQNRY